MELHKPTILKNLVREYVQLITLGHESIGKSILLLKKTIMMNELEKTGH